MAKAKKHSAGILLFRRQDGTTEVFLVHPGGPFWKNKDIGAWSIPKGETGDGEALLERAKIEFYEETGSTIEGIFLQLQPVKQKSGKIVYAWAVEGNIDPSTVASNTVPIEWPPKSGKVIEIPEVDKGEWFDINVAKEKINPAQVDLLVQLAGLLNDWKGH